MDLYGYSLSFLIPATLRALAALILSWIIGTIIEKLIHKSAETEKLIDPIVLSFLSSIVKYSIFTLGCISAVAAFHVPVQSILGGFGIIGFAVGYALKDTLSSMIAGIFILMFRPFRVGQTINVTSGHNEHGVVKDINLRYTTLENETTITLVPNTMFLQHSITVNKKIN